MLSMTGFGSGRHADQRGELRVALASVNNRGWQLSLKSELGDPAVEDELRTRLRTALVRGSVSAQIQVFPVGPGALDPAVLKAAWQEFAAVARDVGAPVPAVELVARLLRERRSDSGGWGDLLKPAVDQALAAMQAAREREGAALHQAFLGQAARLRELVAAMRARAPRRAELYRESLLKRIGEVLQGQALVTPEHLVREVALHAERIDVTEELVRLDVHLGALDQLLAGTGEVGRKLDFLLQEIGREVNTTGAKANDAELTGIVLEAKSVIDQLKEQAANVA